jgi:radical SAM protein with 4Fe4S-binding SPASM domain
MECPHIPELSYGELGEQILAKIGDRRVPVSGCIELTERCNLRCVHCYINQPAANKGRRSSELTYGQWCDILDQLAEEGCLWLLITGGEALLRADFLDIYAYAKRKGFLITLFTNGTLLTPEIVDYLCHWPPVLVDVTLYGITQETYERVTGVAGSYRRCMRGIELLRQRGLPLGLKSVVMTINRHEYVDLREWARGQSCTEFRHDAVIRPRPDSAKDPRGLRLDPSEVVELDLIERDAWDEWLSSHQHVFAILDSGHLYNCGAGVRSFNVDPYGRLSLCNQARSPSYSLLEGSFAEGWHDFLSRVRNQKATRDFECRHCRLAPLCGRCPTFARLENGHPETPVEYICKIAHLRAEAFGLSELLTVGEH